MNIEEINFHTLEKYEKSARVVLDGESEGLPGDQEKMLENPQVVITGKHDDQKQYH